MRSFLRENPTIAFGLGLPLLLVVAFLLVSGLPTLLVASPQHDLLFASEYNNYQHGVQISVVEQKVQVFYQAYPQGSRKPHIWRYDPKTGAVREMAIVLPHGVTRSGKKIAIPSEPGEITLIDVPDLAGLTVDSSSIAPDGYEFTATYGRNSSGLFGGLFHSSRYRREAALTKNGRVIHLPNTLGRYYNNNVHFIGWVVAP